MDLERMVVIDVGNSGAKIGAVKGEEVAGPMRLPRADGRAVRDVAGRMLQGKEAVIAVMGSHPDKIEGLAWEVRKLHLGQVVVLDPKHKGLPATALPRPDRAGIDRRLQVLAASHLAGGEAAVVSCGTAITVDLGDADGGLLGGAILPGLGLGAHALATGTARLPEVPLEGLVQMPAVDTEEAIRTGLRLGAAGAVERLLTEAGVPADQTLHLTGQDAAWLEPHLERTCHRIPGLGFLGAALAIRAAPPKG